MRLRCLDANGFHHDAEGLTLRGGSWAVEVGRAANAMEVAAWRLSQRKI